MYRVFSVFMAVALLRGVKCGESLSGYSGGSSGYSGYSGGLSSGSQSGFQPSVSLSSGSHGYSGGLSAGLSAGSHGGYSQGGYSQGGLSAGLSSGYSGLGSSGYSSLGSGLSLGGHGLSLGSGGYNLGSLGGHALLGGFGGQGSQGLSSLGGHGALASYGGQGSLGGYGGQAGYASLGLGSGFSQGGQGSSGKFELNTDYSKGASIVSNHGGHDYSSGVSVVGVKTGGSGSHNGYAGRHTTIDLSGNAGNQHSGVYGGSFFAGKEHGHGGAHHDSYSSGVSSYDVGPGLGGYATEESGKLAGYGTFEALDSGAGHNSGYPPLGQFH